jgi:hypothetical protein
MVRTEHGSMINYGGTLSLVNENSLLLATVEPQLARDNRDSQTQDVS